MSAVTVHRPTGALLVEGKRVFPIVLSNPPPVGRRAPSGKWPLAEVAAGGVSFLRTGRPDWDAEFAADQIAGERAVFDAAAAHGLRCWCWLGSLANLPSQPGSAREKLLVKVVNGLKGHPGLGVWKGIDEPANPLRPGRIPAAGLVRAHRKLRALDPHHPVVVTQAPRGTVAVLTPYRPSFDITGADVYPVSYPPGKHVGGANRDLSVVGDVTAKMVRAAGAKPVWTTLQIAWSGMAPTKQKPGLVPRFPSLHDERFMAYQAIVAGARGLVFFGGHMTQVATPADAKAGWSWTFWETVLRPLLAELTSSAVAPALVAPQAKARVKANAKDVRLVARREGPFLYVIAVRRGAATDEVAFTGLPAGIASGAVLHEWVQEPPPPPIGGGKQVFRTVAVKGGAFRDWLGPHDARVYRFRP
ncbi:MAG TPA: hypothetical protein VJ986_05305 [Gaiellaceae bacterium]|nr:hypothetical protein [Gaiellaceae bacterium]